MRIGEVARRSGVSARMLRHYESLGLITPSGRTSAGYRAYSADDVARILHVESLRTLGLSLREIGHALDDPDFRFGEVVPRLVAQARERIARERDLLEKLQQVGDNDPADWDEVLTLLAALSALSSGSARARHRAALTVDAVPGPALVRAFLAEDQPDVAGALRWALVRTPPNDVDDALATALRDPDAGVRRRAVQALAELGDDTSTRLLRTATDDADPRIRADAVLALADRGDASSVPMLVAMIVDVVHDVDAADALAALAAADPADPKRADAVVDRLTAPLPDAVAQARCRITQALADLPGPHARAALERLTHDPDEATAATARYLRERTT
ncbi:MAG: MerR family transcriptional regulator [Gordonia sp. (in: high G+C Gram-positive bacteria)]